MLVHSFPLLMAVDVADNENTRRVSQTYRKPISVISMCAKERDQAKKRSIAIKDVYVRRLIKQRFYQWALDQADGNGKRINWKNVSEVVEHHTGVVIATETLRKNFRPASKKQNKPPNQFRDEAVWQVLYDFLISDAVLYLTPSEVTARGFPFTAFSGLQEFFDPSVQNVFPSVLVGRFSNLWLDREDENIAMTVDFFGTAIPGPVRVEIRKYADDEFLDEDSEGGLTYFGGAVHQAGSYIVTIVRELYSREIKTVLLMQTRPSIKGQIPIEDIAILSFDGLSVEPLERMETPDRDASLDDPIKTITYDFNDPANIIFLTRR